jgi:C4-dicarboxylate-specific signal transduction histidine kinase
LDEQGLVIASSFDPSWMLRPVVPLDPNALAAMAKDQRWGKKPAPTP